MTFSNAFSWKKIYKFRLSFHWSLFPRVQLATFHHWFRWWPDAGQATCHYLKQWYLVYWRIYGSSGLNELIPTCMSRTGGFFVLSHTWVRYPGVSGYEVQCPIQTTVVHGFFGDLTGCTMRANGAHLEICFLPEYLFVCEIICFGGNNVFTKENFSCEVFMMTICPFAWINKYVEKSNNFVDNGTYRMVISQTTRHWLTK